MQKVYKILKNNVVEYNNQEFKVIKGESKRNQALLLENRTNGTVISNIDPTQCKLLFCSIINCTCDNWEETDEYGSFYGFENIEGTSNQFICLECNSLVKSRLIKKNDF